MNKENKELLLQDLCARLPYGLKIMYNGWDSDGGCEFSTVETLIGINDRFIYLLWRDEKVKHSIEEPLSILDYKPFLRPLSSMTKEEKVQLSQYACIGEDLNGEFIDEVQRKDCAAYIDWLNRNHFDYRGLIEKGLAIVVNENNNPYK